MSVIKAKIEKSMLLTLLKRVVYALFICWQLFCEYYQQCYESPFLNNYRPAKFNANRLHVETDLRMTKKATHVPKVPTPAVEQLVEGRYKWEVSSHLVLVHTTTNQQRQAHLLTNSLLTNSGVEFRVYSILGVRLYIA